MAHTGMYVVQSEFTSRELLRTLLWHCDCSLVEMAILYWALLRLFLIYFTVPQVLNWGPAALYSTVEGWVGPITSLNSRVRVERHGCQKECRQIDVTLERQRSSTVQGPCKLTKMNEVREALESLC